AGQPGVGREVAAPRPDDGERVGRRGLEAGVAARPVGPAGALGAGAGGDHLDLPDVDGVRSGELLGEGGGVGGHLRGLPDHPAGVLVVAVTDREGGREAGEDLGLGLADDVDDLALDALGAPHVLGEGGAGVVEEVDGVDVVDVDGAGAVVGGAVLVLAPQAERGAGLVADRVRPALAAGEHDDPALDVVLVVPDAAGRGEAGVVVGVGPDAHDVDLVR